MIDQIEMIMRISGVTDEQLVSAYLDMAAQKIIEKAYPFDNSIKEVPCKYKATQTEIALYLLDRRNNVGMMSVDNGGASKNYESGSIPESMLRHIVPFCKVLGASDG